MAGESIVGALRVVLGMDTAEIEEKTKSTASAMEKFGKTLGSAVAVSLGTVAGLIGGVTIAMRHMLEEADNLGKASQKFGIPVEQLSALKYAADLSDVSLETLGKSLTKLSKNMIEVGGGAKNITAAAFEAIGVSVKDANGKLKSSNDLFLDVAEKFKDFNDGATKTALAVAIFGKAGAELIPLLNQGRDGIADTTAEARKLGIILDEKTTKSAEAFNDNLKRLSKVQDAIIIQILGSGGMAAALETISNKMVKVAQDSADLKQVGDTTVKVLEGMSTWALVAAKSFEFLTLPIRTLVEVGYKLYRGDMPGALEAIKNAAGGALPNLKEIFDLITKGAPKEEGEKWAEVLEVIKEQLEFIGKVKIEPKFGGEEQFKLAERFKDTLAKLKAEALTLGDPRIAAGFAGQASAFKDLDGFGKSVGTTLESLTSKQLALNQAMLGMKAAQLTIDNLAPWDAFNFKLAQTQQLMSTGLLSQQAFVQENQKAAIALTNAYGQAAVTIVGGFADAFKTMAEKNKQYAVVAKALAIAEAIARTFVAANTALASPFGPAVGLAQAAAVTAAGLANVAKISATQFAQGGSFTVGGVGGVDSQLVQFKATPGEMIDVRKPGATTTTSEITVNMRGRDLISKDMLRDLFSALNDGIRDGYRLKLAEA